MHYSIQARKYRGFTALELIIVLVVGFSIIALSASKMGQLFSSSSTAAAMSSILDLYTSARSLRGASGYGDESTDLLKLMIDAKMTPKGLSATDNGLLNEWGGAIAIKPTNNGRGFDLTYPQVPVDACIKIAQNLLKSGNFIAISAGATEITAKSEVSEVVGACTPQDDAAGVDLVFHFQE